LRGNIEWYTLDVYFISLNLVSEGMTKRSGYTTEKQKKNWFYMKWNLSMVSQKTIGTIQGHYGFHSFPVVD
jgi:hypothetical protein